VSAGAAEVQAIRHCYARHNEGHTTAWLDVFDPDMEMTCRGLSFFEDGTWHGREEVARQFVGYFDSFGDFRFLVHELIALGDWVLADVTHRGRGRRSGIELGVRSGALYRFVNDRVVEFVVLPTRQQAEAWAAVRR
jgi:ketosteroid isomerase-like protein